MSEQRNWLRKANLIVLPPLTTADIEDAEAGAASGSVATQQGLDLSEMHFAFQIQQADTQSPNNAVIRVWNLSDDTVKKIRGEYSRVVLQAGYEQGAYGIIFMGDLKQFRVGRENATDSYLDLLCADGDLGYCHGLANITWEKGATPDDVLKYAAKAMGMEISYKPDLTGINPAFIRGKVGWGMARDLMTKVCNTNGTTWSIQNGTVQVIPLTGYLPGEAVKINALNGMVGIPEQTDQGISVRVLLNPRLRVGGLVELNNKDINQLIQQKDALPIPFNQWTGIQYASKVAEGADGLYRLYVCEHSGDTRGQPWYSDLVCLAVDRSSMQVISRN